MRALREVREAVCDPKLPLATVVRRALILAYELAHEPFTEWLERELSGYPPGHPLPSFRLHAAPSLVRFADSSRDRSRVEPVARDGQTDAVRRFIDQRAGLREGVAAIEQALAERRELTEGWPSDLAINHATLGHDYRRGPVRAWKAIPRSAVAFTAEAVRNRLLLFVLEISGEADASGEAGGLARPPAPILADAFDAAILHGTRRGGHGRPVPQGDRWRLADALVAAGLDESRVAEVVQAAAGERPDPPSGPPSAEVSRAVAAAVGERTSSYREQIQGRVTTAIRQYWGA